MEHPQPPGSSSHATHNSDDATANAGHGDGGNNTTTLRDRILLHPDVHVGSVSKRTRKLWVHDECGYMAQAQREPVAAYVVPGLMAQREVTYVPALLKIFDEVLLHAADNHHPAMDALRVDVDAATGRVSVYCTGDGGVPIAVHHDKPVFVPETVFGHFTGGNGNPYDNNNEAAGDDRYGVKLANVFSTEFIVEIADGPGRRKYKQVFTDNMGNASYPEVTGYTEGVSFTRVTFTPDLARFNMARLDEDDAVAVMRKRTFDMTGVLGGAGAVRVEFNGKRMPAQCFSDYVLWHVFKPWSMANGVSGEPPVICKSVDGQWEVGVSLTGHGTQFAQVSFVNKIATVAGGTHVDHVARKIATHVVTYMKDRFGQADVDEEDVKRHLMVFVNLRMENPTFDSPTCREALTTPQEEFGSECELSHLFYAMVLRRLLARLKKKKLDLPGVRPPPTAFA